MNTPQTADLSAIASAKAEQRIRRAAHLLGSFWSRGVEYARQEGISEREIALGLRLSRLQRDWREQMRATYGSPEYGSQGLPAAELAAQADAERAIFASLTLEEKLAASIAVVETRKRNAHVAEPFREILDGFGGEVA